MEPQAREFRDRYLEGLGGATARELSIHYRVSSLNYSSRCAVRPEPVAPVRLSDDLCLTFEVRLPGTTNVLTENRFTACFHEIFPDLLNVHEKNTYG